MIQYNGYLYDVTNQVIDHDALQQFTIGQYIGPWTQYENPFIEHQGQTVTTMPRNVFSYNQGNNIGCMIEYYAKHKYSETNVWPVIRILTGSTTDDNFLEWSHTAPNDFKICAGGIVTIWRNCFQWSDDLNTLRRPAVFVTAASIQALADDALVYGGSTYEGDVQTTLIAYCEVTVSVSQAAALQSAPGVLCDVYTYPSQYHITTSKTAAGTAIVFASQQASTHSYELISMAPSTNRVLYPGWNYQINQGNEGSITYEGLVFKYKCEQRGFARGTFYVYNFGEGGPVLSDANNLREAMAAIGVSVILPKMSLYDYLVSAPAPEPPVPPSDVDPDDPDAPTPEPSPPDEQDPYYDPTSDPESPEYDPTKDPESPEYDPTEPHTPYRPPSQPSDPPSEEEHPPQDPIQTPETPPSYVTTNAMFTLYNPSGGDLTNLANFLWSPTWSIDTFKKIFANPLDCILGLMVMPHLSAPVDTKVMNVGNISTGVTLHYFTKQFYDFDCGTFELMEYYNSYLDYSPYTKVNIYLPYIGDKQLSTDEVMNKTLGVKYRFDLATGDCIAFITVDGTVLYSFSGNCAARLPLAGNNWNGIIPAITGVAISAGSMAAGLPALGAASAAAVSTMKETISHTGSISGSAGLMGIQTPYLIITRPRQALPLQQNSFTGYPSFITESLGSLNGYTEVEACHLEHVPCTQEELIEIEELLRKGVLF